MDKTDLDFVYEMVTHLDRTIQHLNVTEIEIITKIGAMRVEELTEYWQQELTTEEAEEIKSTFDHWDLMLISTWAHLQRAHTTRAEAGQALMKNGSHQDPLRSHDK
ncbi:hypothetical protein [Methyloprofundus sp.]|uniref:hypothetical protein n=1 Tax=Methyloprofundus sp. TaxID=2020875 RepID=UPI003D0C8DC8